MAQILPETEVTEFENRSYVNPQVAVDESGTFIDNLRQTQQANTQQIAQDTYNLGTAVPSNLGGLMGGEGYWTSRYQTPQTNATVANLRAAAQAKALNDVLANEQAIWKNRYQQAYRNYQKRMNDKTNQPSTTGGGGGNTKLDIDVNSGDNSGGETNENTTTTGPGYITSVQGGLNVYTDQNGERWTLRNPEEGDETLLGGLTSVGGNLLRTFPDGTPLTNGATYSAGGKMFMYIQNSQYPNGTFFRVGDSPTYSYR